MRTPSAQLLKVLQKTLIELQALPGLTAGDMELLERLALLAVIDAESPLDPRKPSPKPILLKSGQSAAVKPPRPPQKSTRAPCA